jgi:hypothetical protein
VYGILANDGQDNSMQNDKQPLGAEALGGDYETLLGQIFNPPPKVVFVPSLEATPTSM